MKVTRKLVLPTQRDEVWEALTNPERLEEWFANDVDFDLNEGGGAFRWKSGEERQAVVEEAELERRLALRWWDPQERESTESEVVFTLEDDPAGTRLTVSETATAPRACAGEWSWALSLWPVNVGRQRLHCTV